MEDQSIPIYFEELFTNKDVSLKILKRNFPRILEADIKESKLFINFYGVDDIEFWLEDYKKLENTLNLTFKQFYKDKHYCIKVISNI